MKKILILDGGAAHAMAIAECLKKSGYAVAVACDNKNEYGYHCKFADERYLGLDSHQEGYAEKMLAFLKEHENCGFEEIKADFDAEVSEMKKAASAAKEQLAAVEADDLIADRQTDTAAPGFAGALVKFLLDKGQFFFGDTRPIVANGDHILIPLPLQMGVDPFAAAAVFSGVIQYVAEHLLQALRIAVDGLFIQLLPTGIVELDAVLLEKLPVGIDGVFKLRLQIRGVDL